jgi:NTP pyrophosphatase (non-canonical NTP hydrolase)
MSPLNEELDSIEITALSARDTMSREEVISYCVREAYKLGRRQTVGELQERELGYTTQQYQKDASRTLLDRPPRRYNDQEMMVLWNAIGAAGEAGELANKIKKLILHEKKTITIAEIQEEIGDCFWYLSGLAVSFGLRLDQIMQSNVEKLEKRYPSGFVTGGGNREPEPEQKSRIVMPGEF